MYVPNVYLALPSLYLDKALRPAVGYQRTQTGIYEHRQAFANTDRHLGTQTGICEYRQAFRKTEQIQDQVHDFEDFAHLQ